MARTIRTITDFKARLQGGAARPNLFEVSIPRFPASVTGWDDETFNFLCKAAALPAWPACASLLRTDSRVFAVLRF